MQKHSFNVLDIKKFMVIVAAKPVTKSLTRKLKQSRATAKSFIQKWSRGWGMH